MKILYTIILILSIVKSKKLIKLINILERGGVFITNGDLIWKMADNAMVNSQSVV